MSGTTAMRAFDWIDEGRLAACIYPATDEALAQLAEQGVTLLINLHSRPHRADALARLGLTELHLPVRDFTAPAPEQIEQGTAAIERALGAGTAVAVHCAAGIGRTGTLLACHLVRQGLDAGAAIARIRAIRPGSVETPEQTAAVHAYAARRAAPAPPQP